MARAVGRDLPISFKTSSEICNYLKKKKVDYAKKLLELAIQKKKAIPMKRFNKGVAHKPGIAAGSYPVKACTHILALLKSAEANANQKGLNNLVILSMIANKAASAWHYGRHSRRKMKRTHVEIVLGEAKPEIKEEKIRGEK